MLLSLSLSESMYFAIPFLITGALTALLFWSASKQESWRIPKILVGIFFLILTLGIGACFGIMWDFHLDVR